MVLGKLLVPGRPTIWISVGQGPTVLAVGAGGGCLDLFTPISVHIGPSPREREKEKGNDRREKNVQTPTRTYCKHSRPLPYSYPNKWSTCEMSVCGEYVCNMYVNNGIRGDGKFPPLPLSKPLP